MQVQSISNTRSDVNFKSASATDKATAFVNMDESQVRLIAYSSGHDKNKEKKNKNSLMKTFYAIPVVDTIATAVLVNKRTNLTNEAIAELRKTKLSTRLRAAAGTAAFWAVSLSAIEIYGLIKKGVASKSPKAKKFDRENPATSVVTDMAAITAGGILGIMGLSKLARKSLEKNPEKTVEAEKTIRKMKLLINRSHFNQVTLPKLAQRMAEFAETSPRLAKAGRFALVNSVLILFGLGFLNMVGQAKSEKNRVEGNYLKLKQTQLNVAKHLIGNLNDDKKVLIEELKTTRQEKEQAENKVEEIKDKVAENVETLEESESNNSETQETESVNE